MAVGVEFADAAGGEQRVARPLIDAAAQAGEGPKVVLVGIAQEKSSVWRSWPAKGQEKAPHPHMEWGRQMAFVNHFYFYLWDADWSPAFIKTNAYAPYPIWIYLNGHKWAKRQLEKVRIGYEALDNGFRSCAGPRALQRICDRLGPGAVRSFFWRWIRVLPSVFTDSDRRAGYGYELAFRQLEVSDTRVFRRRVNAENWHALVAVGRAANWRLCEAQASDATPAPDVVAFEAVTCPSDDPDGLHAPGLRFGDRRVMALLSAIVGFANLIVGFDNPTLTRLVTTILDQPYSYRQATYYGSRTWGCDLRVCGAGINGQPPVDSLVCDDN